MNKKSKILLTGHRGMVGTSIHNILKNNGYNNIITKSRDQLDLRNQKGVEDLFASEKPEYIFLTNYQ